MKAETIVAYGFTLYFFLSFMPLAELQATKLFLLFEKPTKRSMHFLFMSVAIKS